jgi:lipid A disaccharide synthetase
MRINRTFSIPVELVHELRKKHNQSETVTRALRKYLDNQGESSVEHASTYQLMAVLTNRNDVDEGLKALLLQILSQRF